MAPTIFISYRHADSAGYAGRLSDRIKQEFGRDYVFFDAADVRLGANFVKAYAEQVHRCDVLLAVIGPDWLAIENAAGRRCLDDPNDHVRVEVATALKRTIPVIPVLLEGTLIPKQESLPDDLRELSQRHGLDLHHMSFDAAFNRLIGEIKTLSAEMALSKLSQGIAYAHQGDRTRAAAEFDEAIRLDPKLADAYLQRGKLAATSGDSRRAIADFDNSVNVDPKLAQAYFERGKAHSYSDPAKSVADFTEAISLGFRCADIYHQRAIAYDKLKDYTRGLTDCDQAIRLDPNSADVYQLRAWLHFDTQDWTRAISDFSTVLSLNPKRSLGYFQRGVAYVHNHDYRDAIADFDKELSVGIMPDASFWRGRAYGKIGDYARALADLNECIRLCPQFAGYHLALAEIYATMGDCVRAIAACDEAIRLDPSSPDTYAMRGQASPKLVILAERRQIALRENPSKGGWY